MIRYANLKSGMVHALEISEIAFHEKTFKVGNCGHRQRLKPEGSLRSISDDCNASLFI